MYPNLEQEMKKKRLTNKMMAAIIGVNEKTMYNKLHGETDFTLPEALTIWELFPEYNLPYLFEHEAAHLEATA